MALALSFDARQEEPPDGAPYESWTLRRNRYWIAMALRPERGHVEQILADLRAFAVDHVVPAADLSQIEANLLFMRGDWRSSLAKCEASWRDFDGQGITKSSKASLAARCCLRLGDLAACRDWSAALDNDEEDTIVAFSRRNSAHISLILAVAEGQSYPVLLSRLRTFVDRVDDASARDFVVWVHLLDPHAGDPAADAHPAYAEIRRPLGLRQSVDGRYGAHLLHLDYRLACLRYAAGVPAVDDFYYQQPQQVPARPAVADREQIRRRLHKARTAARSAMRYAHHLDTLLECGFRQAEVRARGERIAEIGQACLGERPEVF
jgi:hypothetical protein